MEPLASIEIGTDPSDREHPVADLPGPSKPIRVEPIERPEPLEVPERETEEAPAEREPEEVPAG